MSLAIYDPTVEVTLTDNAIKHIELQLENSPDSTGLRLYLQTSGCSGYMYETALVEAPEQGDRTLTITPKLDLYIPEKDLPVLNGTQVDFIKVGLNSMFQFKNPNVTGECGCGESFSVTEES